MTANPIRPGPLPAPPDRTWRMLTLARFVPGQSHKLERPAGMNSKSLRNWQASAIGILVVAFWLGSSPSVQGDEIGREIFENECTACHTIGKGKLVGPDLAGVTSRRDPDWLIRQIKEPDKLIEENDPIALKLLAESDDVPMPPPELSDEQVLSVVAYLKSTENLADVKVGLPSEYWPTVLISLLVLIGLTLTGLLAGRKKVDVR